MIRPQPRACPGRTPRISEKQEQASIVKLLRLIGARVYVLGTKRRRGDFQGTMQTPGIPDLFAFLPKRHPALPSVAWIEVKTSVGRASPSQLEFERLCLERDVWHFIGTADNFARCLKAWGFLK